MSPNQVSPSKPKWTPLNVSYRWSAIRYGVDIRLGRNHTCNCESSESEYAGHICICALCRGHVIIIRHLSEERLYPFLEHEALHFALDSEWNKDHLHSASYCLDESLLAWIRCNTFFPWEVTRKDICFLEKTFENATPQLKVYERYILDSLHEANERGETPDYNCILQAAVYWRRGEE